MDRNRAVAERRMAPPDESQPATEGKQRTFLELPSIGGFLIGSFLVMAGGGLVLSAVVTVLGLPLGLLLLAAGLDLMLTPRNRRTRAARREA
jgi:hypothetical protein